LAFESVFSVTGAGVFCSAAGTSHFECRYSKALTAILVVSQQYNSLIEKIFFLSRGILRCYAILLNGSSICKLFSLLCVKFSTIAILANHGEKL